MIDLIFSNVDKNYGKNIAIKDINLSVMQGEIFGLIGPDGAGKTSIMRIAATLLQQSSGIVEVLRLNNNKDFREIRTKLGYMPGKFSLYPDLTVEENLSLFASIFGTTIKDNYYLIKDIYEQIEPFKNRLAGKLSGGMKQKLALSCALIHKPELLLLDEPTTGVDPVSRKEFWEMLKKLNKLGITIFVSTPYMDEAALCDRVALIQSGRILQTSTPISLIKQFNQELLGIKSENKYKTLLDLRNYEFAERVYPSGEYLHYTDKREISNIQSIDDYLATKDNHNISIQNIQPDIEDCFMKLMVQQDD